jgi:PAP2 superfamily protein
VTATATKAETGPTLPPPRRFKGLWPQWLVHHRIPRLWQELLLIGIGYYLYREARNLVPNQPGIAQRHARSVQWLQEKLHLNFELSVNHFVDRHEWLAQSMDYYYATLHFIITIAILVWLFLARKRVYRGMRTALFALTLTGLAGFYLYPLAPPRLMPAQYGYIDTLAKYHTWGSLADPNVAEHTNQFAAMPSLHIGWATWCAIAVFYCAKPVWLRVLAVIYPFFTLMVIVGTANHFVIDAAGGLIVVAVGFGVQYLMSGHPAHQPAPDPPDDARPPSWLRRPVWLRWPWDRSVQPRVTDDNIAD